MHLLTVLLSALAIAETPPPTPVPADPVMAPGVVERPYHHEFSFRGRGMTLPASILDIWYFNESDEGWIDDADRPKTGGYALGFEYCIKGPSANGIFYFDYADATMKEGYWDDVEEPADHQDGSYIVPAKNFGFVAFGADFGYEVHFVRTEDTNGAFGLSLVPGAGLGVLVVTGDMQEWTPEGVDNAIVHHDNGDPPSGTVRVPKVLPMLDINFPLRFNFGDRVVMRLETGLHDVVYYGGTLGIMF